MTRSSGATRPLSEADWVAPDRLVSPQNPTIRLARSLQRRKGRAEAGAFLVEGERAVLDALELGHEPRAVLVREDFVPARPESHDELRRHAKVLRVVPDKIFAALTDTVTPQGIIAVFPLPSVPVDENTVPLVVVADGLQDPGNLGTLLRSAAGAGATLVLVTPGTVDPFNPKVVRGAMGAHFRLPILPLNDEVRHHLAACEQRVIAEAGASTTYDLVRWDQPSAIIVGSEAHGPSDDMRALATGAVSIPLERAVESLNAGVAASIILFEAQRQRRAARISGSMRKTGA